MSKSSKEAFKIVGGDISDGYHTFDELYEHRCLLYINLFRELSQHKGFESYAVLDHYTDWDLLVMNTPEGQISYHVPKMYRKAYEKFVVKPSKHRWDRHSPQQVCQRLEKMAGL